MTRFSLFIFLSCVSLFASNEKKHLKDNQEFDKNLSHNLHKVAEANAQNNKTYQSFISKISARLAHRTRPLFEDSEKSFAEAQDYFLLTKYGAINLKSNPLRTLCFIQDQESWWAYRIKFLGEMVDPKTGQLSPCHKEGVKQNASVSENASLLSDLSKNKLILHHHFLKYLEKNELFLKPFTQNNLNCLQEQKRITLSFYGNLLIEWQKQIAEKNLCLLN